MGIYLQIIKVLKCGSKLKRSWMQFIIQNCIHKVLQHKHSQLTGHT